MSSWKLKKLSEVADIIGGATPKSDVDEYFNGDIPWITPKDLSGYNNRYISKGERNITKLGLENSSAKLLPKGTVLFTSRAPIGYVAIADNEVCTNQGFKSLVLKEGNIPEFFYYLLKHNVPLFEARATGSTFKEVSGQVVKNTELFIPSIDIQKKIVDLVSPLDEKIELNTQINQTLEQIAQTIFKSWFIDFDPVHAKAEALANGQTAEQATQAAMVVISGKNTQELHRLQTANPEQYQQLWEIAEAFPCGVDEEGVPWGWEEKPLDEIAIYQNGLALQKFRPESEDEYLPVVKIAQLKQGYADAEEKASVNIKPECIIDNGDVIFSWSGSLVVDIWCGGKAALNQHLFKVTSKNYPKWLYYFYTVHHLAEFQRIAADKAVTMGHIKREHLSQALCVIPDNEFIQKFCFLEDYISQIVNNRLQNVSLRKTRDQLLPKLLSGEV
ncbi:restriction endonuclease subunit S [Glaesserella parasuis]|uniref:Restriction endonuclease subunit S n=1 Tax=Glaesserella parasuis TaxID=738 RepID=A0A859IGF1_GLAPU|nr:restriction endonuclease subunit S [Glaesserella parasuis]QKY73080.1 restriction endonuclease subunit S [Glaesserella parasuis]